jgi:hypothetical protein
MITQIFVENNKLDLSKDLDATLSFNIDDIKDFGSRNTSFSKTIVIPGTANNNIIFGNIFDLKTSKIYNDAAPNVLSNYNISRSAKCIILQGGIQVFKGVLRIMQIVIDNKAIEYECSVFGELGGFISKLSAKKLTDLDFSEHDHTYDLTTIKKSWSYGRNPSLNKVVFANSATNGKFTLSIEFDNIYLFDELYTVGTNISIYNTYSNNVTATILSKNYTEDVNGYDLLNVVYNVPSVIETTYNCNIYNNTNNTNYNAGYFYPLIDYGNYSVDKNGWELQTFRPALFAKEIIRKIFEQAGYTYEWGLLNTTRFENLIIPFTKKTLLTKKNAYLQTSFNQSFHADYNSGNEVNQDVTQSAQTLSGFSTTDNITYKYTGAETASFNLTLNYNVDYWTAHYGNNSSPSHTNYKLKIYKNGTLFQQLDYKDYFTYYVPVITDHFPAFEKNITLNNIFELSTDDEIKFVMTFKNVNYVNFNYAHFDLLSNEQVTAPININDKLLMNETIPQNILQKDFFASIVKMFNLYVYEDKYRANHLIITPYIEYMDPSIKNDWTYKMDVGKPITIKPLSELNSRFYDFKYKDDSDFYNDLYKKRYNNNYGSYIFDTAYEFAKERTAVELIFSGTPLVSYPDEDKVYSTIMKRTGNGPYTEENTDSNIRILQTKIIDCNMWAIKVDGSAVEYFYQYPYAGHFDDPIECNNDLNYGIMNEYFFKPSIGALNVNQFNIYWLPYMYEIVDQDSRLLIATFRLNEADIATLDFSIPVFINGVLFRLNKIENYNAISRDTCKVELLKIIQQVY